MGGIIKTKTALLTGARGFLGGSVMEELINHTPYKVVATASNSYSFLGTEFVVANFNDPQTNEPKFWRDLFEKYEVDAVINCAGIPQENHARGFTFKKINVDVPFAMAKAAAEHGIEKFIHISTFGAIMPFAHKYGYTASKKRADELIMNAHELKNLDYTIIRPGLVYEKTRWGGHFGLYQASKLPIVPIIGSGNQIMQPIHIDDVVKLTRLLTNGKGQQDAFTAVGPDSMPLHAILKFLKKATQSRNLSMHIPYSLCKAFTEHCHLGILDREFVSLLEEVDRIDYPAQDWTSYAQAVDSPELTTLSKAYPLSAIFFDDEEHPVRELTRHFARNVCYLPAIIRSLYKEMQREPERLSIIADYNP